MKVSIHFFRYLFQFQIQYSRTKSNSYSKRTTRKNLFLYFTLPFTLSLLFILQCSTDPVFWYLAVIAMQGRPYTWHLRQCSCGGGEGGGWSTLTKNTPWGNRTLEEQHFQDYCAVFSNWQLRVWDSQEPSNRKRRGKFGHCFTTGGVGFHGVFLKAQKYFSYKRQPDSH